MVPFLYVASTLMISGEPCCVCPFVTKKILKNENFILPTEFNFGDHVNEFD